ncbi:MAG: hypothetical protein JXB13_01165, partial [Phycisphaerae bacterium]|nr:hypothetical protein [Phycisphaerae bacterium]
MTQVERGDPMNRIKFIKAASFCLSVVLGLNVATALEEGDVIYSDPLNGADTTLTGTAPRDRGGVGANPWTANARGVFRANGRVEGRGRSGVFLPFTPEAGKVYTLSAEVDATGDDAGWISLGFAARNGDSVFNARSVKGYGTMIVRGRRGDEAGMFYPGEGVAGYTAFANDDGKQDLRIVFDAADSKAANWSMTFFNNGIEVGTPRAAGRGTSYANIRYVGFSRHGACTGTVKHFKLSQSASARITLPFGACYLEGQAVTGTVSVATEESRRASLDAAWTIVDAGGATVHEGATVYAMGDRATRPVTFCDGL